jgi:hypothetical integral membrane protein (TIGR02206 family)
VSFLVGCVAMAWLGRRHRGTRTEVRFRRGAALLIPVLTIPLQVLQLLPSDFSLVTSLPLQLCDLAWMVAVVALWTRRRVPTALIYFWAPLNVQAILTPALASPFPEARYLMFWFMHFSAIWAAVYLTFGLRVPITWRSYRCTVAITAGWMVVVMTFNALVGTNYGFLNRKPETATALDLLGPWPYYVVAEVLLVAGVWALMTWPWTGRDKRDV